MIAGAHRPQGRRSRVAANSGTASILSPSDHSDMPRSVNLKGRNNSEESVSGPQMSQQSNSSDDSWVPYQSDSADAF